MTERKESKIEKEIKIQNSRDNKKIIKRRYRMTETEREKRD
jgi:hypothetical protein